MPYEVRSTRQNSIILISLNQGGIERSVKLQGDETAISDTVTMDMKAQEQLNYITYRRIK